MPTVSIPKSYLFSHLHRPYTASEFFDLCFEFGIELEEEVGAEEAGENDGLTEQEIKELGGRDRSIFKIDIPANRCASVSELVLLSFVLTFLIALSLAGFR